MNLPLRMKSGRVLVAVNEARTVGLYGSLEDGYRILLEDRTVSRGEYSDRPYPTCPNGRWFWRKGARPATDIPTGRAKSAKWLRREEADRQLAKRTNIAPSSFAKPTGAQADVDICTECGRHWREAGVAHYHSMPTYPGAKTVCCPCLRVQGVSCASWQREAGEAGDAAGRAPRASGRQPGRGRKAAVRGARKKY